MKTKQQANQDQWDALSKREQEAAIIVAQGYGREEGAKMMSCAIKTFDHHRLEALNKLSLKNSVNLLWFCLDGGILDIEGNLIYVAE